jgi:hypothetical protein
LGKKEIFLLKFKIAKNAILNVFFSVNLPGRLLVVVQQQGPLMQSRQPGPGLGDRLAERPLRASCCCFVLVLPLRDSNRGPAAAGGQLVQPGRGVSGRRPDL